jgi:hypothetical protein
MLSAAAVAVGSLAGCQGEKLVADNGRCGPTPHLLVSAADYPVDAGVGSVQLGVTGMVLDGSDLYFAVNGPSASLPGSLPAPTVPGAVMRVSTYGGAPMQIAGGYAFQTPTLTPDSVLLGETPISSDRELSIASVSRAGGTPTILATVIDDMLNTSPVTDGTAVYFSDSHGLESVPLAPASPPAAPTTVLSQAPPANIGVFGQQLLLVMQAGDIEILPVATGDAGTSVTSPGLGPKPIPQTLTSCGGDACWLVAGAIEQVDPTAGSWTMIGLSGSVVDPSGLVFDGKSFFLVGGSSAAAGAAIVSVPSQGGPEFVVATLSSAGPIAVDDACVYFGTPTGIFSLLKNADGVVVP